MARSQTVRPLVLTLPLEDVERLRVLAGARHARQSAADVAAAVVLDWLSSGAGRGELLRAIAPEGVVDVAQDLPAAG